MKPGFCIVGYTLLFSSIYMSILKKDTKIFKRFYSLLDLQQKQKYKSIIKERLMIYTFGMTLGLVFGYYYYFKNPNDKYIICKFLSIVFIIKLSIYYFFPKSPLMLYSLKTKEQTDAWADIYTEMKNKWIISIIIGFFGYLFLSFALHK